MIFNLQNDIDKKRADERLKWLSSKEKRIEIKELRKNRTPKQNAYLHLILSYFAIEVGEELEYIKQDIFKKMVNPEYFKYERINKKSGKKRTAWKSSTELDTEKMSVCIDRFKNWSVKKTGIRLPDDSESEFLDHIQNEIYQHKEWL